jgi:hypothetical protein
MYVLALVDAPLSSESMKFPVLCRKMAAGAIGTMTLAVMTRATRGHTGRVLSADRATVAIFLCVNIAAIIRVSAVVGEPWVMEWLYLDWASRAPKPLPDNFVYAEWITLHDNPDFRDFVDFLRAIQSERVPR